MKKHVSYMLAGALIAAVLLAGCSSGNDTAAPAAADSQSTQTQGSSSEGVQGPGGMNRAGMNIGKIKSISGSTITVYTSQMPEGRPENSGEGGQGTPSDGQGTPPGGGESGQPADSQQGTPPEGDGQSGEAGQQGGGRQGGMMQSFSEETTGLTVTADTQYVSVTFENGEQKETVLSLADLKADDIIQYTLQADTAIAEKITVSTGGFGGGGRGGAPDGGNSRNGADSSAAAGTGSK